MIYRGMNGTRYEPGTRRNSFYMEMPDPKGYEERMDILDKLSGYTYYIDKESKELIREKN